MGNNSLPIKFYIKEIMGNAKGNNSEISDL